MHFFFFFFYVQIWGIFERNKKKVHVFNVSENNGIEK